MKKKVTTAAKYNGLSITMDGDKIHHLRTIASQFCRAISSQLRHKLMFNNRKKLVKQEYLSALLLRVFAVHGERVWCVYGIFPLRLTPGLLHQSASCCRSEMNLSSAVCLLFSSVCPVITVLFVVYLNTRFYSGACCLPLMLMLFSVAIVWTCPWVI